MRRPDTPISAVDVSALSISPHAQPYVITLAGLLAPGGFVDDAGRPDVDRLRRELAARIDASPELTRRAVRREGVWWWVDASVDLATHIVVEPLQADDSGFGAVWGRLAMTPLDPVRPLWQVALVPAARPGQCGLVLRIHHMLVDGAHATSMLERLFAPEQTPAPAAGPADTRLPLPQGDRPSRIERARFRLGTMVRPRIRSRTLLGPPGPTRDVASVSVDLGALQSAAAAGGGTINDVYLVAVGQGVRHILEHGGEAVPDRIAISVPVQVTGTDTSRNAVGFMFVDVPLTATDLTEAIQSVARQTQAGKRIARDAGPTFRAAWIARWFNWYGQRQRMIGTIASNVRGPREPLAVAGAPLIEIWPLGPLAGNLRVGFTSASYAGDFWVGVEVDPTHTPSAEAVAARVQAVLSRVASTSAHPAP